MKTIITGGDTYFFTLGDYRRRRSQENNFLEVTMNNLNSILIEGRVISDPILSKTPNGIPVCTFVVASNRFYKQGDETKQDVSNFEIETWAKLATVCDENLKKRREVRVVGRLKQDRWVDDNGNNHSKVKIVAEHVEFKPEFR